MLGDIGVTEEFIVIDHVSNEIQQMSGRVSQNQHF